MEKNTIEYNVNCNANRLNEIISKELKQNTFNKKHNLSGEYSEDGGFDIWNTFSLFTTDPYFGPIVKINLKNVSTNQDNTESKLIIRRVNGTSYKLHLGFSFIFIFICFSLFIYQVYKKGLDNNLSLLVIPIIAIIYIFGIELSSNKTASNLIKRIEKLMTSEKIEFKKIV